MRVIFSILLIIFTTGAATPAEDHLWIEKSASERSSRTEKARFGELARQFTPTVVNIQTVSRPRAWGTLNDPFLDFFFSSPRSQSRPEKGQGSGFIINPSGYIVTNYHVVENAVQVIIVLTDGREFPAVLVAGDQETDVALVKIDAGEPLPAAPLGDSERLLIGDWVIAIGHPFGLQHTVTAGIVSAKGRRDLSPAGDSAYSNFIQTDASINPGNSGGPLINMQGEVVGMNTSIVQGGQGIGFAIPSNMLKVLLPQLAKGRVDRSWLGVDVQEVTPELARSLGLVGPKGALVSQVIAGSPAEAAGLMPGDVLLVFGEHQIEQADDVLWFSSYLGVGKQVNLHIWRQDREFDLKATLGSASMAHQLSRSPAASQAGFALGNTGLVLLELGDQERRRLKISVPGVFVLAVDPGSPAARAGVQAGDMILQVGQSRVGTLDELARSLAQLPKNLPILLYVLHDREFIWRALPR